MDWTLSIDRNRDALLRVLAVLLTMVGGGGAALPRHVRSAVFGVLRPAESALRRLIVIYKLVKGIEARVPDAPETRVSGVAIPRGQGAVVPAFPLFDRRKYFSQNTPLRYARIEPRITVIGVDEPVSTAVIQVTPDDLIDAGQVYRRLQALQNALEDLPKQARRLARWQAKRDAAAVGTRAYRPMRPGRPPGHRARQVHPVDAVLSDCHELALYALHDPPVP